MGYRMTVRVIQSLFHIQYHYSFELYSIRWKVATRKLNSFHSLRQQRSRCGRQHGFARRSHNGHLVDRSVHRGNVIERAKGWAFIYRRKWKNCIDTFEDSFSSFGMGISRVSWENVPVVLVCIIEEIRLRRNEQLICYTSNNSPRTNF